MTIANLPAGVTGGFGTVKRTAQWGVRRATGLQLKAPISGQRAMRADLLRAMKPSGHFGFSVSLSIDATAPAPGCSRSTSPSRTATRASRSAGSCTAGSRASSSSARSGRASPGAGSGSSARPAGRAGRAPVRRRQHAKVAGIVQPPANKVVIFGMPGLTWDEMRTKTPNLEALADDGAVADLMVKTASTSATTQEAYASLGTGNPLKASLLTSLALPADADFESDTAANALARRTGERPPATSSSWVRPSCSSTTRASTSAPTRARSATRSRRRAPDRGRRQRGHRGGRRRVAADGSAADRRRGDDRQGLGRQRCGRPRAAHERSRLRLRPSRRPGAVLGAVERAQTDADVVVVDPGDLDRADEQRRTFLPDQAVASRDRALPATDEILGRIADSSTTTRC